MRAKTVTGRRARRVLLGMLGAVVVLVLWEGYKAIGRATDDQIGSFKLPAHTDDLSMPHTWTILSRCGDPSYGGRAAPSAK